MAVRQASTSTLKTMRRYNTLSAGSVSVAASGGTTSDVTDYNGTGQTWRVHQFTTSGTFSLVQNGTSERNPGSANPQISGVNYLLVGGGFNGTNTSPHYASEGNGGAGGRIVSATSVTFVGSQTVTVGVSNGGNTIVGSLTTASGSSVGTSGKGYNRWITVGAGLPGGAGQTSTITGSSVVYGGGGGGGGSASDSPCGYGGGAGGAGGGGGGGNGANFNNNACGTNGGAGTDGRGGGGGGAGGCGDRGLGSNRSGGAGGTGIAILAYRIA